MSKTHFLIIVGLFVGQTSVHAQSWTLQKCLDYAISHNTEILVNKEAIVSADIQQHAVKSKLLPTISAGVSTDHYWQIPVQVFPGQLLGQPEGTYVPVRLGTPWMGRVEMTSEMKLIDANAWRQIKLASLQKLQTENQHSSIAKQLKKAVSMAYYNLLLQEEAIGDAIGRYQQHKHIHSLLTRQFEKGLIDKIALNQSESLLIAMQEYSSGRAAARQSAIVDLKFWMGYPFQDSIQIVHDSMLQPAGFANRIFDPARLPEHEWYQTEISIAEGQVKLRKSELIPNVALRGGYSRLGFGERAGFITSAKWFPSGYVGLAVTVPLFDLDKMYYRLKISRQQIRSAELRLADYEHEQHRNYLHGLSDLEAAMSKLTLQQHREQIALENIALSERKIEKGIIDMTGLKQLHDELAQIRQSQIDSQLNYLKACVELQYLQID